MSFNFCSTLLEAFNELDALYEETSNKEASKRFWAAARENKIDEDAFHAAFDTELTELGLMHIFDIEGRLKHRGVYKDIKEAAQANPDSWAIKALNKLWVLHFVNNARYQVEIKASREFEAARQAKETAAKAEFEALQQEWQNALPQALEEVDSNLLAQFLTLYGTTVQELTLKLSVYSKGYYISLGINDNAIDASIFSIEVSATDKVSELAKVLNSAMDSYVKQAKERSNMVIDVFAAMDKGDRRITSAMAVLLGDSGKLYTVEDACHSLRRYYRNTYTDSLSVFDVKEPYKVIFVKAVCDNSNNYTYRDSVVTYHYSWDSSEASRLTKFIPTMGVEHNTGSEVSTEETKPLGFPGYSQMDNIDTWAVTVHTSYATD